MEIFLFNFHQNLIYRMFTTKIKMATFSVTHLISLTLKLFVKQAVSTLKPMKIINLKNNYINK